VVACPSLHESFGIVVAEAMAAGRAVVVTPGVALAGTVDAHACGLTASAEPQSLARALDRLLSDGALRARCGAAGRGLADRWRWDRVARATLAFYDAARSGERSAS
jgi:glycosyltransferase involved in cell wall biosynthesis